MIFDDIFLQYFFNLIDQHSLFSAQHYLLLMAIYDFVIDNSKCWISLYSVQTSL